MSFSFQIDPDASFAASEGGRGNSIRRKLFGPKHKATKIRSSLPDGELTLEADHRQEKLPRRMGKSTASAYRPHDEHYVSELVRRRRPVEYLGYLVTNEQQSDGNWVASFVRIGGDADCAQRSAPCPASYMAFSEAKRQIDATLSGSASNRKYERVPVALQGVMFANDIAQECQILDLSPGGARLRLDKPIDPQGALHLYIRGFGRFRAQHVRGSDAEIAVRFSVDNETVFGLLRSLSNYVKGYETAQTKLRKEVRVPTSIAAVCRMADGAAIPCEIIDASTRSMSLRISERPRIGSLVTLGGTKVRVMRHHGQGIAVQCLPPPNAKSDRFGIKEE